MGNYLVGIAPSEIFPVEHYLRDHSNIKFDKSLGSTRFFKVARARSQEGWIVVKVFVIHDPALLLQPHKEKIYEIKLKLASAVNCLPFQKGIIGDKACFLMRQYVHHSLCDRISTKPFLTPLEKKWITFQTLCAVHQAHKYGVCHGDIKTENIMITSWNWILLTDFASFKPTAVANDTPADYLYFFDMSRRSACYVAPERFVRTINYEDKDSKSSTLFLDQDLKIGDLQPMMDIFSLGCSLIELYNEGRSPFDFPALLRYSQDYNEDYPTNYLNNIADLGIREMLISMIQRDPANRKSAETYLAQARGTVFPEYFYSFLQPYMQIFSAQPILTADEKISRLKSDIANIMDVYKQGYEEKNKDENALNKEAKENESKSVEEDSGKMKENTDKKAGTDKLKDEKSNDDKELSKECQSKLNIDVEKVKKNQGESKDTSKDKPKNEGNKLSKKSKAKSSAGVETAKKNEADSKSKKKPETEAKSKETETQGKKTKQDTEEEEYLAVITPLVTSCIRGLQNADSKIDSMWILIKLAEKASEETILDRILPYILYYTNDSTPRVRVEAIHAITNCLTLVKNVPATDINVFPEYVLSGLSHLPQDPSVIVRAAYAQNIADLAALSVRYLDDSFSSQAENKNLEDASSYDFPQRNYDNELMTLRDMVQTAVSMLLADQDSLVKRTLMESGLDKLCKFFGKQKASDVLLSHLITFLNDKGDKELRCSFYTNIVDVAAYVGWHCSPILTPLLRQGLTDTEEFVIPYAIDTMAALTDRKLLHKIALLQLLGDTVVYLVHPNLWIRNATVGFVAAAARSISLIDVQIKIQPMLKPYLKHKMLQLDNTLVLLENLVPPIPRTVFDNVLVYADVEKLFEVLEERKISRNKVTAGYIPEYNDMSKSLRSLFRRLNSEQMTEEVEDHLLAMKSHILKISHYHQSKAKKTTDNESRAIDLSDVKQKLIYKSVTLNPEFKSNAATSTNSRKTDRRMTDSSSYATMNQEWRNMFAAQESAQGSMKLSELSSKSPSQSTNASEMLRMSPQHSLSDTMSDHSIQERSYIQYKDTPCQAELKKLINKKQEQYAERIKAQNFSEHMEWQQKSNLMPADWVPTGSHVSFLHEHKGRIDQIVNLPNSNLIASCSSDGTVKIWDVSKMEGKNICNRSKQTYHSKNSTFIGLVACDKGQSLATSCSESGSIYVLRVESGSSKMSIQQKRELDLNEDGHAVDLQYLDRGSQSMLVYATLYGRLVGWDLRSPTKAWQVENDLKHGLITSFCINNASEWVGLGTSSGVHITWDLRFFISPTDVITHPSNARVRKVVTHPLRPSWIVSAVHGNNEISMWNLETRSRELVLWASGAPPLSRTQGGHSVWSMHTGICNQSAFLLASGTDLRVRYWNLSKPTQSFVMLPAANDTTLPSSLRYEDRLIDGTHVIQEVLANGDVEGSATGGSKPMGHSKLSSEEGSSQGPEPLRTGHHDIISAIAMSKTYIITGSCDGLIQVWK